jgi:hypothetical protein
MNRIAMSAAASALLRALIARAAVPRDRILLTELRSTDWQSLTFAGERHEIGLRVPGPDSGDVADRLCRGLEEIEFNIPGQIVAEIATMGAPVRASDGSTSVMIEALTIAE